MPSVNLSPETYEKLKALAARRGCTPDAAAEDALKTRLEGERDPAEWAVRLDAALQKSGSEMTEEETNLFIDYTVKEVRAEEYMRRLSKEDRLKEFDRALEELRSGIPGDVTEAEINADIDAALAEVRAERRARGY